jgi:Fe-S-cluster containining protein
LNDGEIARIATFLGISEYEVIQRHTRLRSDRRGLALMDKPNGECVFLEGNDCAIQSVKPQQCRDFPNLWNFPGAEASCRAFPRDVSAETWERLVREATGREAPGPRVRDPQQPG